jgi:alkylation response protein AidB-like acyl-CoA dehydrogenase
VDLELDEDQLDLRDAVRSVLADACPPSLVRAVVEGRDDGASLWATLVGLDWPALAIDEVHGGIGSTFVEVGVVVEELGRVVAPTPYPATATQFVPAVVGSGSSMRLAEVAAGACTGTLAIAERGRWEPGAVRTMAERSGDGWRLAGTKSHVLDGARADEIVVVARSDEGLGMFLVPGSAVTTTEPSVVDPTLPTATVVLDGVEVAGDRVLLTPGSSDAEAVVRRVLDEATPANTF